MKSLKLFFILFLLILSRLTAQEGLVDKFIIKENDLALMRPAQPGQYMDKIGRKAALIGYESGSFEVWIWPWKVLRGFDIEFFVGTSTRPVKATEILRDITVTPEATTITFVYESFTVKEIIYVPHFKTGAIILLDVNTTVPLSIVPGFLPVMQPQWPAGIGGQYSYWDDDMKAYVISESQQRALFLCGSPAAKPLAAPPAHMLADNPLQFKIDVEPDKTGDKFIPIAIAGFPVKTKYDSVKVFYKSLLSDLEKLYNENVAYYKNLRESTMSVVTPDENLNLAYEYGKVALNNLLVDNPALGEGLVAGYGLSGAGGRPGFAWFFGGDAFINSLAMNSFGDYATVKEALLFTQKWQRQENYPIRKKNPDDKNTDVGKMAHELSQSEGLIDWWNDYHFGYNHADTSPWYLVAMGDYFRRTGDVGFIKKSWPSILAAYKWCKSKDSNGDGLMDLKGSGLGVLEFGSLVKIFNDNYTQSLWTQGIKEVNMMAQYAGDTEIEKETEILLPQAKQSFEKIYWIESAGFYSFGAAEDGRQVLDKNIYSSTPIMFGLTDQTRSEKTIEVFNQSDLTTDWGVRNLTDKSSLYEPANYNYGAVWPFTSFFIGTAQFKTHFNLQGFETVRNTARHAFDYGLGIVPEVFSGTINTKLSEGYHDQGFSVSGYLFPLVRGLIGLDVDALNGRIIFAPKLPADWKFLKVGNIKIGNAVLNLDLKIENDRMELIVTKTGDGNPEICFEPELPPGTGFFSAQVNGLPAEPEVVHYRESVQIKITGKINNRTNISIIKKPAAAIYTIPGSEPIGSVNEKIKIISQKYDGHKLVIQCEGKPEKVYELGITNGNLVNRVTGAEIKRDRLIVKIPGTEKDFKNHEIVLNLK